MESTDTAPAAEGERDGYRWLEDVTGDGPLEWAREHNTRTLAAYTETPRFTEIQDEIREVLDAETRIPYVVRRGEYLYNFWQDAANPRGLWRRTSLEQYRNDKPDWDVLLDVDALATAEDQNWVWHGATFLAPDYDRCLISLSVGGSDADVTREFDPVTREFVTDGFTLPEAKSSTGWVDRDTLYVGTDFGPGSMTDSGYPRVVKRWRRGTPLDDAVTVFEGEQTDVSVHAWRDQLSGLDFLTRSVDFYHRKRYLLVDDVPEPLDVPDDAEISVHAGHLTVELRTDWDAYPAGALLAIDFERFRSGDRTFDVLFAPDERSALVSYHWTEHALLVSSLVDVQPTLEVLQPGPSGWTRSPSAPAPAWCSVRVISTDRHHGDEYLLAVDGYLVAPELHRLVAGTDEPAEVLKRSPARFDPSGMSVNQYFATSADGTRIPYFVVGPDEATGPTLLNGYGGFEIPMLPGYDGGLGRAWLARGGTFAVANIRGGGEYGPRWHQAALKENRHRAYEDFAAVASDLAARGITTPERLGVSGGSNGGLLTGNMFTQYPELFGAVVIQVPLLDMRRYHQLLAGASWMAEYGDPDDPTQWEFIRTFSPYHLLRAERPYPPLLVTTSTRDDRVHPGHARKFVARVEELGYPVDYYENIEGGHGGASNNEQRAFMRALSFAFLWEKLG
ncbi:prolyl oligopeptidase family serine peptidase [Cryptosporangium aurantiacum]|uniref:Prolyl oligopeptidase n=1 Tax=Cryptosporangium aurantiacum TaxID=134849 RepID=A0A1M7QYB0_9ACTN|nr:prolyl oligopeptidase family serine peptidase [Cryptosporangium aurantiacum]SHN36981.1 prolyl oligopeptidase [Cryptosporangium aurantiacum]